MKTSLYAFLLFNAVIILSSCNSNQNTIQQDQDRSIIEGSITNCYCDSLELKGYTIKKSIAVDSNGFFSDTLIRPTEGYYTLKNQSDELTLYLKQGYHLNLTLDGEKIEKNPIINGIGSIENQFLITHQNLTDSFPLYFYTLKDLAPEEKFRKIKTVKDKSEAMLAKQKDTLDPSFFQNQKMKIHYDFLNVVFNEKDHLKKLDTVPPVLTKALNELDSTTFENWYYFQSYNGYKLLATNNFLSNFKYFSLLSEINDIDSHLNTIKNKKIKHEMIRFLVKLPGLWNIEDSLQAIFYNELLMSTKNDSVIKVIEKTRDITMNQLEGKPSPSFTYESANGKMVSLEDFKGKFLYIDVWATWCGPCKKQIPHLDTLREKYKDYNIEFLSISIDKQMHKKKWLKMLNDSTYQGIHLIADNAWNSSFIEHYKIESIPRFILLDDQHKVIKSHAPRPENKNDVDSLFELAGIKPKATS